MTWVLDRPRGNAKRMEGESIPKPVNDPARLEPTKIKVTKPFFHNGRRLDVGEIVTVQRWLANGLVQAKKAELA